MGSLKWGLRVLVLNSPQLPTIVIILRRKFLSFCQRTQAATIMCTIAHDCGGSQKIPSKSGFLTHLSYPFVHPKPTCYPLSDRFDKLYLGGVEIVL